MSGPCCDTCRFFYPALLGDKTLGECTDPTKLIFYKYGGVANEVPTVTTAMTCNNWAAPAVSNSHDFDKFDTCKKCDYSRNFIEQNDLKFCDNTRLQQ